MKYATRLRFRKVYWAIFGYPNYSPRWTLREFWRDEVGAWFLWLLVGLALNVIAYLLMSRQKTPKPESAKSMDDPTASASREIPVVIGTATVKALNVLDFRDKNMREFEIDA